MIRNLLVVLALLLPSSLSAQKVGGASDSKEPPSLFIEVIYWGAWMERPLKFKSNGELKALPLQCGGSSGYVYAGVSPLVLYREEAVDPETKALKPVPILSLSFKDGLRRAILLITPAKNEELKAQLIPVTPETFPPNSVYLANLSGKVLRCKLADRTWEMKINDKGLYPIPGGDTKVGLLAAVEWKGSWRVLFTDSFRAGEGERRIIYFHTPPGTEGVAAMSTVIPPDAVRYDAKGRPIESARVDPDFKPGPKPTGIEGGWTDGPR